MKFKPIWIDTPKLLIGTKTDLRDDPSFETGTREKKVTTEMVLKGFSFYLHRRKGQKMCTELELQGFLECSAKGNSNIELAFRYLINKLSNALTFCQGRSQNSTQKKRGRQKTSKEGKI